MTALDDLLERLEKATGPDALLGREVLLACGWSKTPTGYFLGQMFHWRSPDGKTSFDDDHFHRYDPTRSLDAAMSLVPEAAEYEMGSAKLINTYWAQVISAKGEWKSAGRATQPLALCIAALKSRKDTP